MTPTEEKNVETKVDQLIETAAAVRRALNVRTTIVLGIAMILAVLLFTLVRQGSDLREIAQTNRENGAIAAQNSEAIKNATGKEAQERSARGLVQIKQDVRKDGGEEIDCRSRRQQARIPAPANPDIPCKDQTDASIYPGIDGEPAR